VRVLRHHAGSRYTLWLALDGWPLGGCIAKVYAHGDAAVADVLRAMHRAGFAERSVDRVPALVAAMPGLHILLLDVAPGLPIKDLLWDGAPGAAARAARWLAAFHGARLPLPASYSLHDPLAAARRWSVRLARATPELASDAARMFDALTAARPPWPPHPHLIHGDFGAGHIFVAPEATTVIDWDSCRPGEPPEDAGRFLASLYDRAARARTDRVIAAAAAFQATYVAARPDAAASLPFYTALAGLHKASRVDRHAHHVRRDHRRASTLLEAGLAALGAVHPT
jgi:aminoglycoside phosphotransferase (APT) family kinase protein